MIVAITGLIGSGKDTVADCIVSKRPFNKMSFAHKLKDVVSILYGWDRVMLEGCTKEARLEREKVDVQLSNLLGCSITPRNQLQKIGVMFRDNVCSTFWSKLLERDIVNSGKSVVITDARFIEELDMVRRLGGIVLRVERGVVPNWFRCLEKARTSRKFIDKLKLLFYYKQIKKLHTSETSWVGYDKPDLVVYNNLDLKYLQTWVDTVLIPYLDNLEQEV